MTTGGYQIPGQGPGDDGFEEDGYDESQRAEILEVTGDGPTDGMILTDLNPDIADDDDDDDDLEMESDETGEEDESGEDEDADEDADDADEDDLQEDFEDDDVDDEEITDRNDAALRP